MWFHDQGVLLQVNTGITLQMTSWHNTDIHTNTVRTNFNHFSTLLLNLVLLWLILFEKYFFKHSNPVSSVVSEIKSGVRGSYAAEKVGTLKVNVPAEVHPIREYTPNELLLWKYSGEVCERSVVTLSTEYTHQSYKFSNFCVQLWQDWSPDWKLPTGR